MSNCENSRFYFCPPNRVGKVHYAIKDYSIAVSESLRKRQSARIVVFRKQVFQNRAPISDILTDPLE